MNDINDNKMNIYKDKLVNSW